MLNAECVCRKLMLIGETYQVGFRTRGLPACFENTAEMFLQ